MTIMEIKKSCYGVSRMTLWRKKQQKLKDKTDAFRKRVDRAKQSSTQKEIRNEKAKLHIRKRRLKESSQESSIRKKKSCVESSKDPILEDSVIQERQMDALKILHRTLLEGGDMHQYPICVVCDCFIIGTEKIMNLNRKQLLEHENR